MEDFREDWFFKQWYTKDELHQLWEWCEKSGNYVNIKLNKNNRWSGFHIEDKDFKIDIAGQPTKTDCENWMKRLGFEIKNK
jgi:hypothetical protein